TGSRQASIPPATTPPALRPDQGKPRPNRGHSLPAVSALIGPSNAEPLPRPPRRREGKLRPPVDGGTTGSRLFVDPTSPLPALRPHPRGLSTLVASTLLTSISGRNRPSGRNHPTPSE